MSKQVKTPGLSAPKFNFRHFWDSDTDAVQLERATIMWNALVKSGMTGNQADDLVTLFHNDAFQDGRSDEAYDNCGVDA